LLNAFHIVSGSVVVEIRAVCLSACVAVGVHGLLFFAVVSYCTIMPIVGDTLYGLSLFVGEGDDGALVIPVVVVGLVGLVVGDAQRGVCSVWVVEDGGQEGFVLCAVVQDGDDMLSVVEVAVGEALLGVLVMRRLRAS